MKHIVGGDIMVTKNTKLGEWDKYPLTMGQRYELTMEWVNAQIDEINKQCALNVLFAGTPASVIEPIQTKHIKQVWEEAVAYLGV